MNLISPSSRRFLHWSWPRSLKVTRKAAPQQVLIMMQKTNRKYRNQSARSLAARPGTHRLWRANQTLPKVITESSGYTIPVSRGRYQIPENYCTIWTSLRPLMQQTCTTTQYKHIDSSVPFKTTTVRVKGHHVKGPGIVQPRDFIFTNLTLAPCEDEDSLISLLTQTIDIIHEANRYAITHNLI